MHVSIQMCTNVCDAGLEWRKSLDYFKDMYMRSYIVGKVNARCQWVCTLVKWFVAFGVKRFKRFDFCIVTPKGCMIHDPKLDIIMY